MFYSSTTKRAALFKHHPSSTCPTPPSAAMFLSIIPSPPRQRAQNGSSREHTTALYLLSSIRLLCASFSTHPDLSIFWSLLLETLTTRDTGLSYMRTNLPPLLLSHYTRCKRSAELTSMEGDLLRVVDQDPGLWFGRWGCGC